MYPVIEKVELPPPGGPVRLLWDAVVEVGGRVGAWALSDPTGTWYAMGRYEVERPGGFMVGRFSGRAFGDRDAIIRAWEEGDVVGEYPDVWLPPAKGRRQAMELALAFAREVPHLLHPKTWFYYQTSDGHTYGLWVNPGRVPGLGSLWLSIPESHQAPQWWR